MSATIPEFLTRGVEHILPDVTTLAERMKSSKLRLYLGIDPTGSTLTLGHSVVLRKLQQFAEHGHQTILLIGNGTVRIGDPTGRDSTRPMLTDEEIQANFQNWKSQASKILDFDTIEIRYNGDWLDKLTYADMVKLLAKTTVQQLVERDMFQERIKNELPIHGHEILYPMLQGYDSVAMDVDLEIGGTDQMFNMMMGRHLQKVYNNRDKWVLTTPIINGTDGRKMSKSYGNFVALTENPIDMYGKLMRINDDMIIDYFTLLTNVPMNEINSMQQAIQNGDNPIDFKKSLAKTITEMYHSTEEASKAQDHFEATIQNQELPDDMPSVTVPNQPTTVLDLLKRAMPDESNSQLRRLIDQSAVTFFPAEEKPSDPTATLTPDQIKKIDSIKVGKRRFFKITQS